MSRVGIPMAAATAVWRASALTRHELLGVLQHFTRDLDQRPEISVGSKAFQDYWTRRASSERSVTRRRKALRNSTGNTADVTHW